MDCCRVVCDLQLPINGAVSGGAKGVLWVRGERHVPLESGLSQPWWVQGECKEVEKLGWAKAVQKMLLA